MCVKEWRHEPFEWTCTCRLLASLSHQDDGVDSTLISSRVSSDRSVPAVPRSIIKGCSPLMALHLLVASSISQQPVNKNFHFRKNPSDISQPLTSQGGFQATIPRRWISEAGKPSKRPPMVSDHKSSSSKVPLVKLGVSKHRQEREAFDICKMIQRKYALTIKL